MFHSEYIVYKMQTVTAEAVMVQYISSPRFKTLASIDIHSPELQLGRVTHDPTTGSCSETHIPQKI